MADLMWGGVPFTIPSKVAMKYLSGAVPVKGGGAAGGRPLHRPADHGEGAAGPQAVSQRYAGELRELQSAGAPPQVGAARGGAGARPATPHRCPGGRQAV